MKRSAGKISSESRRRAGRRGVVTVIEVDPWWTEGRKRERIISELSKDERENVRERERERERRVVPWFCSSFWRAFEGRITEIQRYGRPSVDRTRVPHWTVTESEK